MFDQSREEEPKMALAREPYAKGLGNMLVEGELEADRDVFDYGHRCRTSGKMPVSTRKRLRSS